ncbi:MAG: S-layer homology domain-containing protein [Oscillospiraceae bacterium]|nr:S-layer homology domain-containing protein [Oscillospiraceae bacterium]
MPYNIDGRQITGVPQTAGTYEVFIGSTPFRMIIDKAPLHYWADSKSSYYGQPEFRGIGKSEFTFRYSVDDIRSFEKEQAAASGIAVDGNGAGLEAVLNDIDYTANQPTFTARTASGAAVRNDTPVGNYGIMVEREPKSENYTFIYGRPATGADSGKMELTVMRRPIQVVHINGTEEKPTVLGSIFNDEGVFLGVIKALRGDNVTSDKANFTARLATRVTDAEGYYYGYPLTPVEGYVDGVVVPGDQLEITFDARCIQTDYDRSHDGSFAFAEGNTVEYRDAEISNVRLTGGTNWENYELVGASPDDAVVANGVVGEVHLRRILSMAISRLDANVLLRREYGSSFTRSSEMWLYLELDGGARDGDYAYSDELETTKGIYSYWATAEEKAAYESGDTEFDYENSSKLPLYAGQIFNSVSAYSGRYVCLMTTTKDVDGNNVVLRCYSDEPLVVTPRTLNLTATPSHRFYGEENGTLQFTYDPKQLALIDQSSDLTGNGEELLTTVLVDTDEVKHQYQAPRLEALDRAMDPTKMTEAEIEANKLTTRTNYSGRNNSVVIWGAKSDNYRFTYTYSTGGTPTIRNDYGASIYNIERRLIVVEGVATTTPLVDIYADTHRIYTDGRKLSMSDLVIGLPDHTESGTVYYTSGATSTASNNMDITYADGAEAVVNGDVLSFTYTATVVPTDGLDYAKYVDFSHGYYNMNDVDESIGYKLYPLEISNLRMERAEGSAANNYTIVYRHPDQRSSREMPDNLVEYKKDTFRPEVLAEHLYYAAAMQNEDKTWSTAWARVYLRPITDIRLLSVGKTEYTYGETYDPSQGDNGIGDRGAMMIHIEYEQDLAKDNFPRTDSNPNGNPYIGEVQYRVAGSNNGQAYTTFEARSINIYYVKNGQTVAEAIENEQIIGLNSPLYVNEHNGVRLVVAGKRGDQKELVTSQVTTSTLKISKKTLTLYGEDYQRVYGEANPAKFDFTFRAGDLARWDREQLGLSALDSGTGDELAQMSRELGYQYTAPTFDTEAKPNSDVRNGGRAGYNIAIMKPADEGELENYILQYEPGTLYIYPRTVNIQRFISSADKPIYSIFSDVGTTRIFYTNATNVAKEQDGTTWSQFELGRADYGYILENGTALPSTGPGLYPGDEVTLRITVSFAGASLDLSGSTVQENVNVTVTNAELVAGTRAATNYVLQTTGSGSSSVASIQNGAAIGRVELRNIANISIRSMPVQMEYTYGEALNLAGLIVEIHYDIDGSESGTGKTDLIPYIGTDQFAAYGLHVYYYDSPTLKAGEYWGDINADNYREAATGDHLTIAPTHDTQLKGTRYHFAANGKYLVVTAQLSGLIPAKPVIINGTDANKANFGQPVPIRVDPLPITFTLNAEDKVYNGNTQAAGTITFTNIFNDSAGDSWNRNGITDLVYPVIGADYEEKWTSGMVSTKDKFADFKDYVAKNGYSFTTGRYVANDSSIFAQNKTLAWTKGYQHGAAGTLTFSYLDPNVAYTQAPEHDVYGSLAAKEVQVTGLRLVGPDAANYTLVGKKAGETVEVTTANASTAEGYLGRTAGLPTATIHKANRAELTTDLIPQVEIDPHTNVVRVNYDQSLSAMIGGEGKGHEDELHFEFALQKVLTGTGTESSEEPEQPEEGMETREGLRVTDVIQWAGRNGEYKWDDPRYFGGEIAPMTGLEITTDDPEAGAYVPREEDIPKAESVNENTTLKGQVYQWSELDNGFTLDLFAYPGGVYWPGYELYASERTALDRDAVYLAVVRAAETNNYNASPALSSVEGYTSAMVQAILEAQNAKETASTGAAYEEAQQAYEEAVQAASEPLLRAVLDAREAAQAEVDVLMSANEKGTKLEERPVRAAAPAVKTYKQMIETVSTKAYQGASEDKKGAAYQVPILEDVWFTDVEELPSKEVLDAVVWNTNPVRYRRYGYDSAFAAELKFTEEPISLRESYEVEIPRKGDDSSERIRFNEDNIARFYVDTTFPSSSGGTVNPELMMIRPSGIMALLGDKPVVLEAVFYPTWTRPALVQWSSSNPEVAIVDNQGRVSFVGIGTAIITAIVPGGYSGAEPICSACITVTVVADWKQDYPNSIFDFGNQDAFLVSGTGAGGKGDKLFKPEMGITRGETAKLLAQFYVSNPSWSKRGPEEFADLTGEEDYAEAAKLLGHLGVFMGYPEGDFAGEQYISRAEFVTLLARMTGLNIEDTFGQAHAFLDTGEEDTWAYAEIDALSRQTGILYGVGEGYFAPDRNITRSEVAALLVRLLRFPVAQNKELVIPIDVDEEHWARECILRAVNGSHIVETNLLWDEP